MLYVSSNTGLPMVPPCLDNQTAITQLAGEFGHCFTYVVTLYDMYVELKTASNDAA